MWTKETIQEAAKTWVLNHPGESLMEAFIQGAKFIQNNTQKE